MLNPPSMSLLSYDQQRFNHPAPPEYRAVASFPFQSLSYRTRGSRSWVTVDKLPDVALLEIFAFYLSQSWIEAWCTLVHVCRKWRRVVFGSPLRLNLRLYCEARTPVREMLCVWPLLPIVIRARGHEMWGVDNIIAALQHSDRICQLELIAISSSHMDNVLAAMQQPFPELTRLELRSRDETTLVPSSFLGGSSPSLQTVTLACIQFPGLPKLLSSATHLVHLYLHSIPHSGYISPEALASCFSVLTRLETLIIGFESPRSRPDWNSRHLPSRTRTLLPVLTTFQFKGVSEYLEDLVAKMDAPLLDKLMITFFNHLIFDTPQITQFICRTPNFNSRDEARVAFSSSHVWITFPQISNGALELSISCSPSDWQLSTLAQVCSSSFPQALIPAVERLYIIEHRSPGLCWQDDIESSQWLQLLHPFTSLKDLYVSQEFVPRIAPALRDLVEEGATEVLLAPQRLFVEEKHASGPVQKIIRQFVVARQLAGHPVVVSQWEEDLWTDGYIAHTFAPKDAEIYLVGLLNRAHSRRVKWRIDVTGAVLAAPPAGLMSDQHDWVIDYVVRDTGPVIQEKIWTRKKTSDRVRRVDHEPLKCPFFFIHNNGQDLGLPLIEAAGGNCMCLRGAEEAAPVLGPSSHVQIRINWRGYEHLDWSEQIPIKKQTLDRETVSIKTFAKHVGRKVFKFMEFAKNKHYDSDQRYLIGDHSITPRDIILIGIVQVSQGSWMPILQLNNWQCMQF